MYAKRNPPDTNGFRLLSDFGDTEQPRKWDDGSDDVFIMDPPVIDNIMNPGPWTYDEVNKLAVKNLAAANAKLRNEAKMMLTNSNSNCKLYRAAILVFLDQINLLRLKAVGMPLQTLSKTEFFDLIKTELDNGNAD